MSAFMGRLPLSQAAGLAAGGARPVFGLPDRRLPVRLPGPSGQWPRVRVWSAVFWSLWWARVGFTPASRFSPRRGHLASVRAVRDCTGGDTSSRRRGPGSLGPYGSGTEAPGGVAARTPEWEGVTPCRRPRRDAERRRSRRDPRRRRLLRGCSRGEAVEAVELGFLV